MNRIDAIFTKIRERFPRRAIREWTWADKGWHLGGELPVIEYIDGTLQDIGGPKDAHGLLAVKFWEEGQNTLSGQVFYISDHDLPPPKLLPMSSAVKSSRVDHGLDPVPALPP